MSLNKILVEFTNEGRFAVLKSLYEEKKKHNQLEKELNIPGPEISRHLKRLCDKELVSKSDNNYQITELGKIFFQVFNILERSLNLKDFINAHDISAVPINLILQLGGIDKFKIGNQTMKNVQLWGDLVKNSDKFIMGISDQFQDSILPILEKKTNNQSLEIKALIEEKMLVDSVKVGQQFEDRHAFYEKIDAFKNVRISHEPQISLLVTDKGSVLFLSKEGKIDYSQCLFDETETFINWTLDLFNFYWKKGKDLKSFIKKK